jgi:hypothetical protein
MTDTYAIAKNLALTGALGYSNKDVSAMLKLTSQLRPGMDELIRAERGRFAAMPKAIGGITAGFPKDLYTSITGPWMNHAAITELGAAYATLTSVCSSTSGSLYHHPAIDTVCGIKGLEKLLWPTEADRRRGRFRCIEGGVVGWKRPKGV